MQNEQNNTKFWPAKTTKTGYSVTYDTIQWGTVKTTHKFSVCEGKVLLGMTTWEEENPEYVTPEEYAKKTCKSKTMCLKFITIAQEVYQTK